MKYTEFKNAVDSGSDFSIVLLEGEDRFFLEKGRDLLKNKFLTEPSINLQSFSGDSVGDDFFASLSAFPFMSEKRITEVSEFYPKSDFIKGEFKDFLSNPPKTSLLIVINSKKCETLKKFGSVTVVDCNKMEPSILTRWIKAECNKEGVEIDMEACRLLVDYTSSDMTRISTETGKLISFAKDTKKISVIDIENMVSKDTDYKIYKMTEYIGKKQFSLAVFEITEMLNNGEPPQKIITSVYNYFRKLLFVGISGKTPLELSAVFGVQEFAVKNMIIQSSKFNKRSLKRAVDMLTDFDYSIKSGKIDEFNAMWISVFKIMTEKN